MDREYTSFLIQCNSELKILKTFWYQPAHLISPYQEKIVDLFAESDKSRLAEELYLAFESNEIQSCEEPYALFSPKGRVSLCLMPMHDFVLIFGIDADIVGAQSSIHFMKDVVHRFMNVIKTSDSDFMTFSDAMIRNQFEKIQKLNNDLLNMQRELRKANSKLNRLNRDLNNRLVKDFLTGLVSRYQYREEIELTIGGAPERQGVFTFLDIDDFKGINDTLGHRAGDDYLKEFSARLLKLPFDNMICMRIAGDEFGLYIHGYEDVSEEDVSNIWFQIKKFVLEDPISLESEDRTINCSAGMAVYGKDTKEIYDLIEYADFAMYEAKNSGKNSYSRFNMDRYKEKKISIL
ncbi:GGDEF domain-containing protein [Gudongella sp. SC589]|uniref:GGDEF domain-containing protein n=1 Tax=Gudongella sp. SC589 TaxID=3385990 RepID=UPI003904BDF0